jgi:hypothetical protein
MTTDTPRTDAFFMRTDIGWDDEFAFSRQLERELAHSLANQLKTQAEVERLKVELQATEEALQQMTRDAISYRQ